MAATGSGWSCNYCCLLYTNTHQSIPSLPFNNGFVLRIQSSHFLHLSFLQKFISLNQKDRSRTFYFPTSSLSTVEKVSCLVAAVLRAAGAPTTDEDSLVRRLFAVCRRRKEMSSDHLVPLCLDIEIVTVVRNREEALDWYFGGTMDSVVVKTLRATKPAIDGLELSAAKGAVDECMVCLEGFEEGEKVAWLPCRHGYHQHCIRDWLKIDHRCPVCRFPMPWVWCDDDSRNESK